jgi:hypothetical protein
MPRRPPSFTKSDARRGLLSAVAAGMKDPCLVIDATRKIAMVVPGELLVKNGAVPEAESTPLPQGGADGR